MKLTMTGEAVGHHDISVILSRELDREERGSKVCVLRLWNQTVWIWILALRFNSSTT